MRHPFDDSDRISPVSVARGIFSSPRESVAPMFTATKHVALAHA
jgi:hypothetical protein